MKKLALLLFPLMIQTPVFAGEIRGQRNVHYEEYCYRNVEKYKPGFYNEYGTYSRGSVIVKKERIPCGRRYRYTPPVENHYEGHHQSRERVDDNSCVEGSILGGILGGGAGAALSRGDGRWWAIPLGIAGGAMVGCQVDGG